MPSDSARFQPAVSISRDGRGNSRCSAVAKSIRWPDGAALEMPRGPVKKNLRILHGHINGESVTEVHRQNTEGNLCAPRAARHYIGVRGKRRLGWPWTSGATAS